MKVLPAWLLCLLLLCLTLQGSASRAHPHSMEARTPAINPAWYTGRGIRPVGRFGRRWTALEAGSPATGSLLPPGRRLRVPEGEGMVQLFNKVAG
ncbi:prolactin-releasing peptide [Tenrec ecaudatus]|uniref:prolactin-releasing peptide n=1 Tax=Tenrec ecaudatus TaxID=94439 RepID=UPI003F5A0DF6